MRFNAFADDAPLDCQPCAFPWNPKVTFHIFRSGRRAFAARRRQMQADAAPKMLALLAKRKKLTIKQMDPKTIDLQKEFQDMPVDEAIAEFGPEIVGLGGGPDVEGIARHLVKTVDGPLILADDSEKVLGWHDKAGETKHCGLAFLEAMPDAIAEWIEGEADRIEDEFATFMEAASGNSQTTSAGSEAEVEGAGA